MANQLGTATSPYLLQHKDNPVDWWPWGPDAFAEAQRRDLPLLLSVGYAACHWCHVMAHESFEDEATAALLNEHFVAIKVDREERPDVDAVYMDATTALTGHGGWPMTCLLNHDGTPFYAGTYFPRADFQQLINAASQAWRERRDEVLESGVRIVAALARVVPPASSAPATPRADELDAAADALVTQFDRTHAGFGGAPKFPPSMVLEFLLRRHERTGDPTSLAMAEQTFEAMARGGMYDQLGGGFARYSVDAAWVVPHFEKMLYDNALLLRAYLHWWRLTSAPLAERVARETADFLLRELRTPEGGFASALDADTDGIEGLTYSWTPAQLAEVLGADAPAAAELFSVTSQGTFEDGASTLQLRADPLDRQAWEGWRRRLFAARSLRSQPGRDDKIVTAWNGLAMAALAEAGVLFNEPAYLDAASDCARLVTSTHLVDGRLRRTSRAGVCGSAAGVADDHGDLAEGLLVLYQATGDTTWLSTAGDVLDIALAHFGDRNGGFFDTADDAEALVRRPRDPTDNATPSGASSLVTALVAYASLTGSARHREAAQSALASVGEFAVGQPRFFGWWLAAAEALLDGSVQIAVVGDESGELTAAAWRGRPPGAVVVSGMSDADGQPLLADRPLVFGEAAAYVCRAMVCSLPVTSVADLRAQLGS